MKKTRVWSTSHHRRTIATTSPSTQPELENDDDDGDLLLILKPAGWLVHLIAFQLEAVSFLLLSLLSMAYESLHRFDEARDSAAEAIHELPIRLSRCSGLVLRKLGLGFLAAAYAFFACVVVLAVAVLLGVGLVHFLVEDPVSVREPLYFDYTDPNPSAVVSFAGAKKRWFGNRGRAFPVGHTLVVSVVLLVPDSDFNRHIGVFQLTAQVLSTTGAVLAKSRHPCMLRYRSLPVRLMRTLIMGMPLLMGFSDETQQIKVGILRYKEGNQKTGAISIRFQPRAGTTALPELYAAEVVMNSQLPCWKALVHNWKWTLYVWASLYMYVLILMILVSCLKPLIFPVVSLGDSNNLQHQKERSLSFQGVMESQWTSGSNEGTFDLCSDRLRKWRCIRNRRKALLVSVDQHSAFSVVKEKTI